MFKKKKIDPVEQPNAVDREFEAKFKIDQALRVANKSIAEMNSSIDRLTAKAIEAKKSNNKAMYTAAVGQIVIVESKIRQSEKFIFQTEMMRELQTINKKSEGLLSSIGVVMQALSDMSLDSASIAKQSKQCAQTQVGLAQHSLLLDQMLDSLDYSDALSQGMPTQQDIESRINAQIEGTVDNFTSTEDITKEIEDIKRAMNFA